MAWYNPFSWSSNFNPQQSGSFNIQVGGSPQQAAGNLQVGNSPGPTGIDVSNVPSSTNIGQQVLSDTTYGGGSASGPSASGSGGPGGSTTNTNGGAANFLSSIYQPAVGNLQNAYNNIFGQGGVYDTAVGQAGGNLQKSYGAQQSGLDTQYAQSQQQLPWEYAGRGLGSSSFNENANEFAKQQYNNSTNQIQAAEAKDIAALQQQEQGLRGQYQGYLSAFNNPAYTAMLSNAPSYIQSEALNNVLQDMGQLNYTQGANTPINTALAQLNSNPTYSDQGSAIIKQQLDALAKSGTTAGAQNQIAQGIISNPVNPQNQSYWNNYWQNLQNQGQIPVGA